jgi:glutamate synthase (NADPH/NADH) large chain
VYDEAGRFPEMANADSIVWTRLASRHWEGVLKDLVRAHADRTGSPRAAQLLSHWDVARGCFWQICPTEMLSRLLHPLVDNAGTSSVAVA